MSRFFERFILCCSKLVQHYFENKGSYNYCITIVFTPQNTPIVKKTAIICKNCIILLLFFHRFFVRFGLIICWWFVDVCVYLQRKSFEKVAIS